MGNSMKGFRCWSAASVGQTVYSDIGALPSDADAVFLAAHTPMALSHLKGPELPDAATGERQVLEVLLASVGDPDRNTLIAVTGGSGAGKSHVVRWVHAHLNSADTRYHVLYVPRAVQTIRELLRRIVVALPGSGGEELMERVDAAVARATPAELQDRLLEEMRLTLTWTLEPRPADEDEAPHERAAREDRNSLLGDPDEQDKRRNGLADLLSLTQVNRALLRSEGRLHRLVQSFYEETSRRDEQQESFGPEDLPLREAGMHRAVTGNGNSELRGLWNLIRDDPAPALDLLDEALRQALPRTLGLRTHNGETLDLLFRRSRQTLRDEGKELVLLFEDLAQFGLIDGELYDQFVTQPGADLAPLRVLFAVTDEPYKKLPATVQTRITHQFSVESSALADREAFVARYLNLVRLGRSGVEAAWSQEGRRAEAHDWVKNACDTREDGLPCRVRDECHGGFGTIDVPGLGGVGLYPYNEVALRRALDRRGSNATPRDVLDVCVSNELLEAEGNIERGAYPHEHRVLDRFDFTVQRAKDAVLRGRTGEQAERLYRALVLWGDEASLAPAIADAFSLEVSETLELVTPQPPVSREQQAKTKKAGEATERNPLLNLYQWRNGRPLPDRDANRYRDILYRLVSSRLDLDQDLFHTAADEGAEILNRIFNRMSFNLEDARGRAAGAENVRFDIRREAEDMRVLIGAQWFADHGHWKPEGSWPWPSGYEPVELMLSLECRLEQWAETVRRCFRDRLRGRGLARAALGTRAVALLAAGGSPELLGNVGAVLSAGMPATAPSISAWTAANRAAAEVIHQVSAGDVIGQFAAVRQGDTGAAQLVDVVELESGLREVARSPVTYLRGVAEEFGDVLPALAKAAHDLFTAVEQAAPDLLQRVTRAVEGLEPGLQGRAPRSVARAAREVGRRALDSGLFRPSDGWNAFANALEALEKLPPALPLDWRGTDQERPAEEAVAVQHWARDAVVGAEALGVVRECMSATRQECTRSSGVAGDLNQRVDKVRAELNVVAGHLQALSTAEARHG